MKKRIISVILTLCMVLSFVPTTAFAAGSITPAKPGTDKNGVYQIGTAAELYGFAELVNGGKTNKNTKAVLTKNIVVNTGVLKADGTLNTGTFTDWTPIGNDSYQYYGKFDGQGHTISGLYFNKPSTIRVGLFEWLGSGGEIKNVGIIDSYFRGYSSVGGVCALNYGTITNCYNTGTVSGGSDFVGGVCGYSKSPATITNCYNTGTVSGYDDVGGVCGWNSGTITGCYNTGTVNGSVYVGGVCGGDSSGTIIGCYNTGEVNGSLYVGGLCGDKSSGTITGCYNIGIVEGRLNVDGVCGENSSGTITDCYTIDDEYTENKFKDGTVCKLLNTALKNANSNICFYQGEKSPEFFVIVNGVYQINSAAELYGIAKILNEGNAAITSKLLKDIELSSKLDLSDKKLTLDLNGHILKGDIKLADNSAAPDSILTLIDSNKTATHTDKTLPIGGVLKGGITLTRGNGKVSHLYANGGTITGMVSMPSFAGGIFCTSNTPTAFMGYVGNYGEIHGGIFYGSINESCIKAEAKTVTFMNDNNRYAIEVVDNGNKVVAPITPSVKAGNPTFVGWYNGDTKYNFNQIVTEDITLTARWKYGNISTENELKEDIALGDTSVKLINDINLSSTLDLSGKNITIDLNGYVISGADILINTGIGNASLTLTDSNPTATHTDSTLPLGGVVTSAISMKQDGGSYHDCILYGNGGTVTSEFNTNTNAVAIKCTSNSPTAFTGKILGYAHLYGGIYYNTIESIVTIHEKKVTFKCDDKDYAYEIVASGNNVVAPITPSIKAGYQSFDGWYNGDTEYTFGSTLSANITLTAKFGNLITYNISYDLDGGTADNPTEYSVESNTITLNNPTKTGYIFTGWSGIGLSGSNNMTVTIPKGSIGDRTYTAHYTMRSGYSVEFDTNGGSNISGKTNLKWTDKVLEGITATTKDGWEFTGWKYGDETVNDDTKYCYLVADETITSITLVAQWKDIAAPVISGIENGKTYCSAQTVRVSDNDVIVSVTVNGDEVTPDENNQFTLNPAEGTQTIVAIDKAGNVSDEMIVTVNNGHTDENPKDHKCDICGENVGVHEDKNKDHKCDYGCNEPIGDHKDDNKDHACDYGCNEPIGDHKDDNKDHKCNYGCNEPIGDHKVADGKHTCDYCGEKMTTCKDENPIDHLCDICGETLSQHSGGTATCTDKATCDICGEPYGELDSTNHNLENIPAKDATVTEEGNIEYWHCIDCGKYFSDIDGKNSIELKDTVIAKLPPEKSDEDEQPVSEVTDTISNTDTDNGDIKGSKFAPLKVTATSSKKKTVTLTWSKVSGAKGYIVYGAECGKTMKKIKTTTGKSYTVKNLKNGKYYKYMVVAYKTVDGKQVTTSISKVTHVAVKGGKFGNATKITVNKIKPIKQGEKFTLKVTVKTDKKVKNHVPTRYESTNTKIAKVNSKGVITAKAKGECNIYVYAQNGVYKKVKVTIK